MRILTIHFLEHLPHRFNIVVIEEPSLAVVLVLFKGHCERVRHVDDLSVVLAE